MSSGKRPGSGGSDRSGKRSAPQDASQQPLNVTSISAEERQRKIEQEAEKGRKEAEHRRQIEQLEQLRKRKQERERKAEAIRKRFFADEAGELSGEEDDEEEVQEAQNIDETGARLKKGRILSRKQIEERDEQDDIVVVQEMDERGNITQRKVSSKVIDDEEEDDHHFIAHDTEEEEYDEYEQTKLRRQLDNGSVQHTDDEAVQKELGDGVETPQRDVAASSFSSSSESSESSKRTPEDDPLQVDPEMLTLVSGPRQPSKARIPLPPPSAPGYNVRDWERQEDEIEAIEPVREDRDSDAEAVLAVERAKQRDRLEDNARAKERVRMEEAVIEDGNLFESDASNDLSHLGTAAVGTAFVHQDPPNVSIISKIVDISRTFTFETFTKTIAQGKPPCYNNHCDNCILFEIAAGYGADPTRLTDLINRSQRIVVAAHPAPQNPPPSSNTGPGSRNKRLAELLNMQNAPSHEADAPWMDPKYPWKVLRIIPEKDRPSLLPVTRRPKEKFGEICAKAIVKLMDSSLVPLIHAGRLEIAHFTLIPVVDYKNLSEAVRLRQYGKVLYYWYLMHKFAEENPDIVVMEANMEVHPATKKKGAKKDQDDTQKELEVDPEFEAERDKIINGNDGDAHEEEIPDDADEQRRYMIEKQNRVNELLRIRNNQNKAELAQRITDAIKAIDILYLPLAKKKFEHKEMTKEEIDDYKDLKKRRQKLEKSKPNILAGFPHFEVVIWRLRTSEKKEGSGINTLFQFQQYMIRNGCPDTVQKRIMPKKNSKKDSFMHDLTWECRYPLIGHNCEAAISNMKAAGILLDGKRGVTWMYYNDTEELPLYWHHAFKNFISQLQTHDNISLSDVADSWKYDASIKLLTAEEASEEQLLIERINNLMRAEGLYLYADKCIVRVAPGTRMGAEIIYEDLDAFVRHLNDHPSISRDLLAKMTFLDSRHIVRLPLRRTDLCFDFVEIKDAYYKISAKEPIHWDQVMQTNHGFYIKGKTYHLGQQHLTSHEIVEQFACDPKTKAKRLLAFYDADMMREQMMKPPEQWLAAVGRYFRPKNAEQWQKLDAEIKQKKAAFDDAQHKLIAAEMLAKNPPKSHKPNKRTRVQGQDPQEQTVMIDPTVYLRELEVCMKERKRTQKAYYSVQRWTPQEEYDFFDYSRRMLFVPAARQKSMFIVGKTGAGKTLALCWLHGETKPSEIDAGIPAAKGLFNSINAALFGGQFSTATIIDGVTKICVINEMMVSRAKLDDALQFLEHGSIEIKTKHRDHKHGNAAFPKAFTGNEKFFIKGKEDVSKALRDRFIHFVMNKKVPRSQRDPAYEAKVRLEKFNIVYYLTCRLYDDEYAKWWKATSEQRRAIELRWKAQKEAAK